MSETLYRVVAVTTGGKEQVATLSCGHLLIQPLGFTRFGDDVECPDCRLEDPSPNPSPIARICYRCGWQYNKTKHSSCPKCRPVKDKNASNKPKTPPEAYCHILSGDKCGILEFVAAKPMDLIMWCPSCRNAYTVPRFSDDAEYLHWVVRTMGG